MRGGSRKSCTSAWGCVAETASCFPCLFSFSSSVIEPLIFSCVYRASLVAQRLKRLSPMRETRVRSSNAGDPGLVPGEDPWRRKWQSTPVFLPGEPHGQRSLVGYRPRGPKELDTTEWLHLTSPHTPHGVAKIGCNWVTNTFFHGLTINRIKIFPSLHCS